MFFELADIGLINYYKTEYAKEWHMAQKSGIKLTSNDIRVRLNLK